MRLLLLSNSTRYGGGYLDYCADELASFLGPAVRRVTFIPYAVTDRDGYVATVRARFEQMGLAVNSVHDAPAGPVEAIEEAEALFVGGGNTFRLVDALWRHGLVDPIGRRVHDGMPYIGSSAGSNVACPSIGTTNDMPIIEPPSFAALNLVPFNINPHYQAPLPTSTHMGETRDERIAEFHEEHERPVVGLREGAWLRIEGAALSLGGTTGARLFRHGHVPVDVSGPSELNFLISSSPRGG